MMEAIAGRAVWGALPTRSRLDFESAFADLPCMAMIERAGFIVARNVQARRLTGFSSEAPVRIEEILVGAIGFRKNDEEAERRQRFDCLLLRRHGPPVPVNVAMQGTVFEGDPCRLLLLMERGPGLVGAFESPESFLEGSFLEDVLDATPEATVITHEGRVLHVNREFSSLFGYSLRECMGADLDELVVPDGRLHESEMILHVVTVHGRSVIETIRRTRSGEEIEVSVLVAQVRLGAESRGQFVMYRDIRRQKLEEARLQHTALHDGLTGLANRALFLDRVQLTIARLKRRPDRVFSVAFLDLDGFKRVNDTLGHAAGDDLLIQVAQRLQKCVRPQDTVARFGGDEFALLLDESGTEAEVGRVMERLQAVIQRGVELQGTEAWVSASIGVAMATTDYARAEEILMDADFAMYEAKAAGKAKYVIFAKRE